MGGLLLLTTALLASEAGRERPVDFDTEVVPVLTRAGCNAGACHGAAVGRGGFKLSLLGGDPAHDHEAVVSDLEGRRVNLARPESSLLLAKPTGVLDHGGGRRLAPDGEGAGRIRRWIAEGAGRRGTRRLTRLDVEPTRRVVEPVGAEVALRVSARFDEGPPEDVTRWAVFSPSDPDAVAIERAGPSARAVVRRAGQNVVVARYLDRVVPVQLLVPLGIRKVDLSREPRNNFIDDHILTILETLRIPASPGAGDAAFLRRARLDLTGRLPSPDEVRDFLAIPAPDKRTGLVDRLLGSDDFRTYWAFRLATLLRVRSEIGDAEGAVAYHDWLRDQVARGAGFDAMARALLTATGDTRRVGPANFYRVAGDARSQAEYAAEAFLGVRLRCANCHNHPLDRWTQDDYHGLAAVFARVDRGKEVKVLPRGEVAHPRTGEPAVPRLPGTRFLDPEADNRAAFADWLTAPSNPFFARAAVNRLWKALMGRGLVEPSDDLRATNPATHPELLDALASDFAAHGYDLRHTLRLIASSAAYGRDSTPIGGNESDDRFYSHAIARPLGPEVLADALADVTGVPEGYGDLPAGTRAIALANPQVTSESLDALGRCPSPAPGSCDEGTAASGGLAATLHLLNGAVVNRKIAAPEGRLKQLLAEGATDDEVIGEFTLRALGRPPKAAERAVWAKALAHCSSGAEREAALEDVVWSLLNSREFRTNH